MMDDKIIFIILSSIILSLKSLLFANTESVKAKSQSD